MNTMKMLVKREYWENKGGIFWAQVIVGGFYALMLLVGIVVMTYAAKNGHAGEGMRVNGVLLNNLSGQMSADEKLTYAHALSSSFTFSIPPLLLVLAFVVFFYSLSSLYDDRKDKSILFWKSML